MNEQDQIAEALRNEAKGWMEKSRFHKLCFKAADHIDFLLAEIEKLRITLDIIKNHELELAKRGIGYDSHVMGMVDEALQEVK